MKEFLERSDPHRGQRNDISAGSPFNLTRHTGSKEIKHPGVRQIRSLPSPGSGGEVPMMSSVSPIVYPVAAAGCAGAALAGAFFDLLDLPDFLLLAEAARGPGLSGAATLGAGLDSGAGAPVACRCL